MAQTLLTNTQKIATLLVALGAERSAQVLEYLEPEQITRIAQEIAAMGKVPVQTKRAVLTEFRTLLRAQERRAPGMTFAEHMLDKTLGAEKAHTILQNMKPASTSGPVYLATIAPQHAAELVASEPVPIIARLLMALPAEISAEIQAHLPDDLRALVTRQLLTTPPPTPEMRVQLERAIRNKATRHTFSPLPTPEPAEQPHVDTVVPPVVPQAAVVAEAPMPKTVDDRPAPPQAATTPTAVPPTVSPLPTPVISMQEMNTRPEESFETLNRLSMAELQQLVAMVGNRDLGLALRGADSILRERMIEALPFGRRVTMQTRMKTRNAVSLRTIAESQERIMAQARVILQEGHTAIGRERLHA